MAKRARILLIGLLLFLLLFQTVPHEIKATANPTNLGLAEFAHKALRENWGYVYGTYGQVISQSVLTSKIKQYPSQFAEVKKDGRTVAQHAEKWLGGRAADCVGLAKAYLWWQNDSLGPKYTAATDVSANGLYNRSTVNGPLSNMPATHGLMLWRNGHVGIYIGNDEVIEARGVEYGVVKTRLADRNWTRWFIHPDLAYISQGWVTLDHEQYYYRGGQYVTGEQTIDGRLYLFASDGRRLSGMQQVGGSTVYYPTSGQKVTGWQTIEGNRYYLASNSKPLTGWQTISGQLYYFADSGILQQGWQEIAGQIYYLAASGQPQQGLVQSGDRRYLLADNGQLQPGVFGKNGLYYTSSGAYLLNDQGQPLTGWQELGGSQVWFDPADGRASGPGLVQTGENISLLTREGRLAGADQLVWSAGSYYYLNTQGQPLAGTHDLPAYQIDEIETSISLTFSSSDFKLQLPEQNSLQATLLLAAGQTGQLLLEEADAKELEEDGDDTNDERIWINLNPAVATLAADGQVLALAPGRTLLGFYQAEELCLSEIIVYSDSTVLADQLWPDQLAPGSAAAWPFSGLSDELAGLYQLTSSDPAVLAVTDSGLLLAKKPGSAVLSLERGKEILAERSIQVQALPLAVAASLQTLNLNINQVQASPFSLLPAGQNKTMQYSSNQPATVQVDEKGQLKALKAGQAVITASHQGLQASVTVQVSGNLPLLKRGSSGEHVHELQEYLIELGYLAQAADGIYASADEFAVRSLQVKMQRAQTGEADSSLQKLIYDKLAAAATKKLTSAGLARGDKGEQVLVLQQRLIDLNTFKLDADGSYGDHTVLAVQLFQQLNGLPASGKVGQAEINLLYQSGVLAADGAPYAGATGPEVVMLQQRLQELGFYKGTLDGIYSSQLTIAVRSFQQKAGLTVDGKAGPLTNKILYSSDAPRQVVEPDPTPSPAPEPTPVPEPTPGTSNVPPPSSLTATLKRGSKGEDVRRLQLRLNELGFSVGTADGSFGAKTEQGVLAYQRSAGLAVDGRAGPLTLASLFSSSAPAPTPAPEPKPEPEPTPAPGTSSVPPPSSLKTTLKRGSKGEDVRRLQLRLNELGFSVGTADGSFGAKTEQGVLAYQRSAGLAVDGRAGPLTLASLFSSSAPAPTPAPAPEPKPEPPAQPGDNGSNVLAPSSLQITLRRGSKGEDVRRLQLRLNSLGFSVGTADGSFGAKTEQGVLAYQRSAGLAVDGRAGPKTLASLFGSSSSPVPAPETKPEPEPEPEAEPPAQPGASSSNVLAPSTLQVTLRRGSKGENVRRLQLRLNELGFSVGTADGSFGAKTEQGVLAYQRSAGLAVDGRAGPKTLASLFGSSSASAPPPAVPEKPLDTPAGGLALQTLRRGNKSENVRQLQLRLTQLGYELGTVDGSFGAKTEQAVRAFQKKAGLAVDGVCGPQTLAELNKKEAAQA